MLPRITQQVTTNYLKMKQIIMITVLLSLFSCFSSKTENKTEKNKIVGSTIENINNSPHSVITFQIENQTCFATINEYFKNYKFKSNFPYSLWITVETAEKNDKGHPTDKEASLFNDLEDSIIKILDKQTPYCFIGRTTRNGFREIMMYVSDKEKTTQLLNKFIAKNQFKRKIEFSIDKDENWKSVSGLIE
jgi:hypothetical protein